MILRLVCSVLLVGSLGAVSCSEPKRYHSSSPTYEIRQSPISVPSSTPEETPATDVTPAPPPSIAAGGGPNPPDFLRPKPEKVTSPVEVAFALDAGQALKPGGEARVTFTFTPLVDAVRAQVRYEVNGPATVTPRETDAGAAQAGVPVAVSAKVSMNPGRSELRAWAEGFDAAGNQIFARSEALYFIVKGDRVLAGPNGYQALEIHEMERQRDAGEISPEEFKQRINILRYGGAKEEVRITPPQ